MRDHLDRWARRRRRHIALDPDEEDEDVGFSVSSAVPQAELDKRRRGYVFGDGSRLKPARIDDIKGMSYITDDIKRFIAFLKDYQKFRERNVRVQPGVLLHGEPGTGKTLTARVIATETGTKVIDAGSFPRAGKMWTAADISSLFALAREYHGRDGKPVIIYFDEIDAVCPRERRYRSEASTAMMTELDGMGGKPEGVFVIASSNERSDIDEGLLRAGRIGQHIEYHPPGYEGRLEVLGFYLEKKPHEPIDVEGMARIMPDFTPAEIEELIEKAYINVCLDSPDHGLREADLVRQLLDEVIGSSTGTWSTESERYRACVHEAGHAVVGTQLGYTPKLVVVPGKMYNKGVTLSASFDEEPTPEHVETEIASIFGGEIAEEFIFGNRSLGGTNDVKKATDLSINMAAKWNGKTNYLDVEVYHVHEGGSLVRPLDEKERSSIYAEASRVREKCYQVASEALRKFGNDGILYVAKQLEAHEFLLGKDVEGVVEDARNGSKVTAGENSHEKQKEEV